MSKVSDGSMRSKSLRPFWAQDPSSTGELFSLRKKRRWRRGGGPELYRDKACAPTPELRSYHL